MSEITIGGSFPILRKPRARIAGQTEQTRNTMCLEYLLRVWKKGKREREIHKPEILQAGDLLLLAVLTFPHHTHWNLWDFRAKPKFLLSAGDLRKDVCLSRKFCTDYITAIPSFALGSTLCDNKYPLCHSWQYEWSWKQPGQLRSPCRLRSWGHRRCKKLKKVYARESRTTREPKAAVARGCLPWGEAQCRGCYFSGPVFIEGAGRIIWSPWMTHLAKGPHSWQPGFTHNAFALQLCAAVLPWDISYHPFKASCESFSSIAIKELS